MEFQGCVFLKETDEIAIGYQGDVLRIEDISIFPKTIQQAQQLADAANKILEYFQVVIENTPEKQAVKP